MKVVTLNCNGFQACVRKGFFDWLESVNPDVLCLQEVRFSQDRLTGSFTPPEKWYWAQVDAEKKADVYHHKKRLSLLRHMAQLQQHLDLQHQQG